MDSIAEWLSRYDDPRSWSMVFENRARDEQWAPCEARVPYGPQLG